MIKVIIKANSRYPINRRKIRESVRFSLQKQGIETEVEVGIKVVGDRKMKQLNQKFMKKKGVTDVLSFPLIEVNKVNDKDLDFVAPPNDILYLGDIVICYPQARKQAQNNNILVDEEIERLVQHGLAHLLGKHHS